MNKNKSNNLNFKKMILIFNNKLPKIKLITPNLINLKQIRLLKINYRSPNQIKKDSKSNLIIKIN